MYPTDEDFIQTVREEVTQQVRQLFSLGGNASSSNHHLITVNVSSSGSAPEVSSFHHHLEREQWKWSCSGDRLVQHPAFPATPVPERLRDTVCVQHQSNSSRGERCSDFKLMLSYFYQWFPASPLKSGYSLKCVSGGPQSPVSCLQSNQWGWIRTGGMGGGEPVWPPLWGHSFLQLCHGLLGLADLPSNALRFWVWVSVMAVLLHCASGKSPVFLFRFFMWCFKSGIHEHRYVQLCQYYERMHFLSPVYLMQMFWRRFTF